MCKQNRRYAASLILFVSGFIIVARTIHYFEAMLAVLAIVVWHLYFNIFHPTQYPLNLSMTTGKVSEEDHREDGDIENKPPRDRE